MSDDDFDQHGSDEDGETHVRIPRANIRQLEKQANEGKAALERAAKLEREIAFRDAGISPTDDRFKYFAKGYEGEFTPEAIRAEAIRAGFLADTSGGDQGQGAPPQADLDAMNRSNSVVNAPQTPSVSQDSAFNAELANAKSPAEIMAVLHKFKVPTPGME